MDMTIEHLTDDTFAAALAKVDVDREPALASRYVIRSIPTLLVFRDGALLAARSGVIGADELVEALDRVAPAMVDAAEASA